MMESKKRKYGIQDLQNNEGLQVCEVEHIIPEISPELIEKIFNQIQNKRYDEQVSKDSVLHHLKQLKAQMGKELAVSSNPKYILGIKKCMEMIDKKIKKINDGK